MTATGGVAAAGFIAGASELMAQEASPVAAPDPASSPVPAAAATPVAASQFAYVGADSRTAATEGADAATTGISVFAVNPEDGALSLVQTLASDNAFFFAFDPTGNFLYAVNVIGDYDGGDTGSVEAYAVDRATGMLTFINRQSSGGAVAAHLSVDPSGRYLVVANYNGKNFVLLPINEDGSLEPVSSEVVIEGSGPNEARQDMSHPHAVTFDPAGKFIAGADLGVDKVFIFQINAESGTLEQVSEASTAAGAGPRHVAFNAEGTLLYVVNELDATIAVFAYDSATGTIGELIQTISTVPDPFEGTKSTAEIFIHPSGKFLYNSNRGQPDTTTPEGDAIVVFSVDPETGELTLLQHMTEQIGVPWSFAFDASGAWLYAANYDGNSVTQYAIDQNSGALTFTGNAVETPRPFVIVMSA
jgi:6-phosphogluconolactonase